MTIDKKTYILYFLFGVHGNGQWWLLKPIDWMFKI